MGEAIAGCRKWEGPRREKSARFPAKQTVFVRGNERKGGGGEKGRKVRKKKPNNGKKGGGPCTSG